LDTSSNSLSKARHVRVSALPYMAISRAWKVSGR